MENSYRSIPEALNEIYIAIATNQTCMNIISIGTKAIGIIILIAIIRKLIGKSMILFYKKAAAVVKKTSARLRHQDELNQEIQFHDLKKQIVLTINARFKGSYDRFEFDNALVEQIKKNITGFESLITKTTENKENASKHMDRLCSMPEKTTWLQKKKIKEAYWIPFFLYRSIENRIYTDKHVIPVTDWQVILEAIYISPNGRNRYRKQKIYEYKEIMQYVAVIKQGISSAEYQRKLMSPSLRYDILKRDKFTCRICGRSAQNGANLHVDHIIPISKGGQTHKDNLRTLCDLCNQGKSAKYDPDGLN